MIPTALLFLGLIVDIPTLIALATCLIQSMYVSKCPHVSILLNLWYRGSTWNNHRSNHHRLAFVEHASQALEIKVSNEEIGKLMNNLLQQQDPAGQVHQVEQRPLNHLHSGRVAVRTEPQAYHQV